MITDPSVDATVHQSFTEQRKMQNEWLRSVRVVERARVLAWNSLPILARQNWLALAEAEDQRHQMKETK